MSLRLKLVTSLTTPPLHAEDRKRKISFVDEAAVPEKPAQLKKKGLLGEVEAGEPELGVTSGADLGAFDFGDYGFEGYGETGDGNFRE